jgi:biotin carboxyl carrier protein
MSQHEFLIDGEIVDTTMEKNSDICVVTVGDAEYRFIPTGDGGYTVTIDGVVHQAAAARDGDTFYVDIDSHLFEVRLPTDDAIAGGAGDHGEKDKIFAPMPGKIVKLLVAVGDTVAPKQPLVIVEAMKMENPVQSKADGVVKAVNFAEGDQVDTESAIIELELAESE